MSPDAIIVGGGIVGAACAHALSGEGLRVHLYESSFAGAGATSAAMGHVVVMDDDPVELVFTRASVRAWSDLAGEAPRDVELVRAGTVWVAAHEGELAQAREKCARLLANGVGAELLTPAELRAAAPLLREGLPGGVFVPGDCVLYPPAAARWLLARARDRGAVVHEGVAVTEVGHRHVLTSRGRSSADVVVVAAGCAAATLLGAPIVPKKGHLVATDRYPGASPHQVVELGYHTSTHATSASVAFNVQPRPTGQLLVGSSRELVGYDAAIDHRVRARMITRALSFMPALATVNAVRTWTGFRPSTPDHRPLIGRWPSMDGVWLAAGHEGLGITTALPTARLLADLVLERPPALDPAPFAPDRPSLRALASGATG